MARRNCPFLLTPSINAKPHNSIVLVTARLDMNIGRPGFVRITDELIDEAYHGTFALFSSRIARVMAGMVALSYEFAEQAIEAHLGRVGRKIDAHRFDDRKNVLFQPDCELWFFPREHASDVIEILS